MGGRVGSGGHCSDCVLQVVRGHVDCRYQVNDDFLFIFHTWDFGRLYQVTAKSILLSRIVYLLAYDQLDINCYKLKK